MKPIFYDIECYPNIFTVTFETCETMIAFEISDRRNDWEALVKWVMSMRDQGVSLVGFNSIAYDCPVLHHVLGYGYPPSALQIYSWQAPMFTMDRDDPRRRQFQVWESDWLLPQVDLYLMNHFDNAARRTGLKQLEFAMRSDNIEDLPFKPGEPIPVESFDTLLAYNAHDVRETRKFDSKCSDAVSFREQMTEKTGVNHMNFNDTKIGKQLFIRELNAAGIETTRRDFETGKTVPIQTHRPFMNMRDIIFDSVRFESPGLNRFLEWWKLQSIEKTKGAFDELAKTVPDQTWIEKTSTGKTLGYTHHNHDGSPFRFVFGTGGIHGSVESQVVSSSDTHVIVDLDVTSYYPSLAISNNVFPEHLGETFCRVYADLKQQRVGYAKGTVENAALKLALNGVYGDSNNRFSPFFDPLYTMKITVNGQFLLVMLAEQMMKIPGLTMVQANTDGITMRCPREYVDHLMNLARWWESITGLELERADYSRMFIRDVNNYIAEYEGSGKLKRKGCYEYKRGWHQDHSALVVPKAAEAALVRGEDIATFITNHGDTMDFLMFVKADRNCRVLLATPEEIFNHFRSVMPPCVNDVHLSEIITKNNIQTNQQMLATLVKLSQRKRPVYDLKPEQWRDIHSLMSIILHGKPDAGRTLQNATRYFASIDGGHMVICRPPTKPQVAAGKTDERVGRRHAGHRLTECNDIKKFTPATINYQWYIDEARALVECLR